MSDVSCCAAGVRLTAVDMAGNEARPTTGFPTKVVPSLIAIGFEFPGQQGVHAGRELGARSLQARLETLPRGVLGGFLSITMKLVVAIIIHIIMN